jgi:hypothetical protein
MRFSSVPGIKRERPATRSPDSEIDRPNAATASPNLKT